MELNLWTSQPLAKAKEVHAWNSWATRAGYPISSGISGLFATFVEKRKQGFKHLLHVPHEPPWTSWRLMARLWFVNCISWTTKKPRFITVRELVCAHPCISPALGKLRFESPFSYEAPGVLAPFVLSQPDPPHTIIMKTKWKRGRLLRSQKPLIGSAGQKHNSLELGLRDRMIPKRVVPWWAFLH